jgi:transposase
MNWAAFVGKITGTVDQHLIQRNEYLLAENRVLRGRVKNRIHFADPERISLAKAAKPLGRSVLAKIATLVSPDTLLRWHRRFVEKPVSPNSADDPVMLGRPPTDAVVVDLVLRFARENPSWGYDRIVGALAELGHFISDTTVGNILKEYGLSPAPQRKQGTSWKDFIAAHKDVLIACDFFTKEIWTLRGIVTYYVLFFIHIGSRKVHIAGFTPNPNQKWRQQIGRKITMIDVEFANGMKYLILDRDSKFTEQFQETFKSAGIEPLRFSPQSPNLNAYAERFVRSIKEECLNHLILFGEASLNRALENYVAHHQHERPHQGMENKLLFPISPSDPKPRDWPVECEQRLGGLLKFYHRKAA